MTKADLFSNIFAFGSPCDRAYGFMVLQADGTTGGYTHFNETHWDIKKNILTFYNEHMEPTSRLKKTSDGSFLGYKHNAKWPVYLIPVLNYAGRGESDLPKIAINSIPKSGTYLLERILTEAGWRASRLHFAVAGRIFDYRGMADADIHVLPDKASLQVSMAAVALILGKGEIVVGHSDRAEDMEDLASHGVVNIQLVRNLRNVLVSLFRFKQWKVPAFFPGEEKWREAPEGDRFFECIEFFKDRDLAFTKSIAEFMVGNPSGHLVKYEDLIQGNLGGLRFLASDFAPIDFDTFENAARRSLNRETPTFSGKSSSWEDHWDDRIETYFRESGLQDLNVRLGYESPLPARSQSYVGKVLKRFAPQLA